MNYIMHLISNPCGCVSDNYWSEGYGWTKDKLTINPFTNINDAYRRAASETSHSRDCKCKAEVEVV